MFKAPQLRQEGQNLRRPQTSGKILLKNVKNVISYSQNQKLLLDGRGAGFAIGRKKNLDGAGTGW